MMQGQIQRRHDKLTGAPDTPVSTAIYQLARAHKAFAASMLRELGLYPNQELLLMQLEGVESRPQSDLVRTLMLDHSTVAKSLRRMEAAGLVARRPSASDRRAVDVSLTQRGTVLLERIHAVWAQLEATATQGLSARDTEELVAGMHAMQRRIEDEMASRGVTPVITG
jgi:DNA-binding MarR family transcriptional regulator